MAQITCGCKPGTYETGWHEVRSTSCLESERREFIRAIVVAEQIIQERRNQ